jgi:cytoskeleton protein RodZ
MDNDLADAGIKSDKAMSAGKLLSRKRLDRGFDLADAARATRIPLRHLEAIEKDNYDRLPAYPYAVGFVRNYAKYLGLAPDEVVSQFKSETTLMDPTLTATLPEPLDESRMPSKAMILGGLAAAAVIIGAGAWFLTRTPEAQVDEEPLEAAGTVVPEELPASPPVMSQSAAPPVGQPMVPPVVDPVTGAMPADGVIAPAAALAVPSAPMPAGVAAAGISPIGVVLRANEDSWIKVSDGSSPSLRTGILKAGDTYTVPNMPGLKLLSGNAGGLDVFVNGRQLPPLGGKGETVKGVSMDPAQLLARQSAPAAPR